MKCKYEGLTSGTEFQVMGGRCGLENADAPALGCKGFLSAACGHEGDVKYRNEPQVIKYVMSHYFTIHKNYLKNYQEFGIFYDKI